MTRRAKSIMGMIVVLAQHLYFDLVAELTVLIQINNLSIRLLFTPDGITRMV